MAQGLVSLDGPVPQPPANGLLAAAQVVDDVDFHWLNGGTLRPYPPGVGRIHDPCATGSTAEKTVADSGDLTPFGGYTVYFATVCTGRSLGDFDAYRARAVAALLATEGYAVERELAVGGGLGAFAHLTDTNLDQLNGGTATSPENGLALLEDAIADTGKAGLIHASPATATAWAAKNLVEQAGTRLVAKATRTPIAVGRGYKGVKPDGGSTPNACSAWAFATGPVIIRRTEVETIPGDIASAMDRGINDVTVYAERHYLHAWDRELQAGVLINRGTVGCS